MRSLVSGFLSYFSLLKGMSDSTTGESEPVTRFYKIKPTPNIHKILKEQQFGETAKCFRGHYGKDYHPNQFTNVKTPKKVLVGPCCAAGFETAPERNRILKHIMKKVIKDCHTDNFKKLLKSERKNVKTLPKREKKEPEMKKILYIPNLIPIDWGGVGIKETHCTEIDGRTNCSKIFNDWPTEFPLAAMEDCECKEESSLGCDSEDVEPQLDHCLPIADKCEIKRLCDRENLRNRICRQAENVFVTNMEPNGKSKSTISANY
ncbi:hypothetical protein SNEBB_009379 [Seison nebaliae]|nr:hypothetical protein SNEBB_009379 [Seison nebaliae]